MRRRNYIALGGALFSATIAGCGTDQSDDNGRDRDDDSVGDEEATPTEGELPEAGQLSAVSQNTDWLENATSLSGNGQTVTDPFTAAHFMAFVYEHSGESNFIVELIDDATDERVDVLINQIGTVSGTVGIGLEQGDYVLDIDADGDWAFELGQPYAPESEYGGPPASITGQGPDVYGELEVDGQVTVTGEHNSESNFLVMAWNEGSQKSYPDAVIFNEIGQFQGETSVQLSGLFYITVDADGEYQIDIE